MVLSQNWGTEVACGMWHFSFHGDGSALKRALYSNHRFCEAPVRSLISWMVQKDSDPLNKSPTVKIPALIHLGKQRALPLYMILQLFHKRWYSWWNKGTTSSVTFSFELHWTQTWSTDHRKLFFKQLNPCICFISRLLWKILRSPPHDLDTYHFKPTLFVVLALTTTRCTFSKAFFSLNCLFQMNSYNIWSICFNISNGRLNSCRKYIRFEMRKVLATIIFPMTLRLRFSQCFIVLIKILILSTQCKSISPAALDPLKCTPNIFTVSFSEHHLIWSECPYGGFALNQIPLPLVALIWRPGCFENWLTRDKALVTWSGLLTKRVT